MRRKEREQDRDFAFEVIRDCEYATLATVNAENTPYCLPISIVVLDEKIYFHGGLGGLKLENIAQNNNVCLSCVRHTKLLPEKFTTEFESAIAIGSCTLVTDETEKIRALRMFGEKYASSNMDKCDDFITRLIDKTAVGRIDVTKITGKAKIHSK